MNSYMIFQNMWVRKWFRAQRTHVRFLSCMNPNMSFNISCPRERFVTQGTTVLLSFDFFLAIFGVLFLNIFCWKGGELLVFWLAESFTRSLKLHQLQNFKIKKTLWCYFESSSKTFVSQLFLINYSFLHSTINYIHISIKKKLPWQHLIHYSL